MQKQLLIIGFVWPEPQSSAAGSRMMQLISTFQSENYNITFASPCAKSDNAFNLESINVTTIAIELNSSTFNNFVQELQPNIVLFDRFMMEEQFGWRVAEQCPSALRVLDTEDLHGLRKGRTQAFKANNIFDDSYLFNATAKREIASIYRSDLSLIISEAEMQLLKDKFKVDISLLQYLPFMLDEISHEVFQKLPKYSERQHFITIGNFLHEPNYNAVLYLKETIWPLIRKQLPKAVLHIYGAYASQKVTQLHDKREGFYIKGFAEDVNVVMQNARVCLVPLRFGAGLKGKLIDAMLNGTPSVMTTTAAEGLFGDLDANGFIVDNPQEFANKAVELYTNENVWRIKKDNCFGVINMRFKCVNHRNVFIDRIAALQSDLETHRLQNFTGQMLRHHSLQSTKFMSKWIEEKNK